MISQYTTCYGQVAQTFAITSGEVVRNIGEILYTLRNHQFLVSNQWRVELVKSKRIECHKCNKNYFYVEIQTRVESEFLSVLSDKFVCALCLITDDYRKGDVKV